MTRRVALLLCAAMTTALLAAQPANAVTPRTSLSPIESLPAFVGRYQAAITAIQTGDCAEFNRLNLDHGLDVYTCDDQQRRALEGFGVLGYRQFGTGAVIDVTARDFERLQPAVSNIELLLGADRRFHVVGTPIIGPPAGGGVRQVGSRATAGIFAVAQATANLGLLSLRQRDCTLFFRLWFTGALTREQACARVFGRQPGPSSIRRLRIQLAGDPFARPVRIGGTRDIQFYRVLLRPGHYFTLLVDRAGRPPAIYLVSTQYVY
jgi:hypothetical protein